MALASTYSLREGVEIDSGLSSFFQRKKYLFIFSSADLRDAEDFLGRPSEELWDLDSKISIADCKKSFGIRLERIGMDSSQFQKFRVSQSIFSSSFS